MKWGMVQSVQLCRCTDEYQRTTNRVSPPATHDPLFANPCHQSAYHQRFTDRTVHPLRQTWVQMRGNPRSRTQILSLRQQSFPQTRTDLCAPERPCTGQRASCQLQGSQRDARGDILHQSRAASTQRGFIEYLTYGCIAGHFRLIRYLSFGHYYSEHAAVMDCQIATDSSPMGGGSVR